VIRRPARLAALDGEVGHLALLVDDGEDAGHTVCVGLLVGE